MYSEEERQPPEVVTSDTENRTTIDVSEAPSGKQEKFKRFRAYNRGTWNGPKRENKEVTYRQDNLHRYDSVASKLLTRYQRTRGRELLKSVDVRSMGIGVDAIIFGIAVLVANADVSGGCRYYPNEHAGSDEQFSEVANSLGLSQREQVKAIEKVRSRVDL